MEWRRLFRRKRWLINIPTISWQIIWEFTKDTIIEATRNYFTGSGAVMGFLDYLLQHPIIIVGIVAIIVFIWAYVDTNKERQNDLKITVQSSKIRDWWPDRKTMSSVNLSNCPVEVIAKFSPIGEIRLDALKLHIGKHSFSADELPVTIVNKEATYEIGFTVPNWVITRIVDEKGITGFYIRGISGNRDWCSDNFGSSLI